MVHNEATDLPPSAKLREMQQNTHGLVQLIRVTTPDAPPLSKQLLNACPITTVVGPSKFHSFF